MRPQEALAAVVRAIQASPFFDPGDIITDEFDPEGRNNRLETPFVVVLPVGTVRDQTVNADRVDFITDDTGSRVGEVYEAVFEMDIQSDIYLARGDDRNVTTLGGRLRRALYQHDSAAIADPFPDPPDGSDVVDDIRDFDVGTGQRADDLSGPGVRRWRHESSMRFVSRVTTTDGIQPFETIVTPTDEDLLALADVDRDVSLETTGDLATVRTADANTVGVQFDSSFTVGLELIIRGEETSFISDSFTTDRLDIDRRVPDAKEVTLRLTSTAPGRASILLGSADVPDRLADSIEFKYRTTP